MPVKNPARRPERRKQVASLREQNAKALTIQSLEASKAIQKTASTFSTLLLSKKKIPAAKVRAAERAAKDFLKLRGKTIRQRRKYVESSVAVGKSPGLTSVPKLQAGYIQATILLKAIERYRQKAN